MILVLPTVRRDAVTQPEVCTLTAVIRGGEKPTLRVNAPQAGAGRAGAPSTAALPSPELAVVTYPRYGKSKVRHQTR